jgi:hypothetical protein
MNRFLLDVVKSLHYNSLMPVIKRFGNCTIKMYADEHPPAHFHVEFSDGLRCAVEIDSLEIIAGVVSPPRRLKEPLTWAAANRELLRLKWKELTE